MNNDKSDHKPTRRRFLARAAAAAAVTPVVSTALAKGALDGNRCDAHAPLAQGTRAEPFYGRHQGGIATAMHRNTYFMAFNMSSSDRSQLIALLKSWTAAAAEITQRNAHSPSDTDESAVPHDSGAATGLLPSRLTVTFGFGPTLFEKNGEDRFGIAKLRPAALADLPRFPGDQLIPERCGGDLSVQASADDPQVAEYAIRRMASAAYGIADIAWAQSGFCSIAKPKETPRNTMGFKDGTMNIRTDDADTMQRFVWVGDEGPAWMQCGSYMVIRPIRIALEHWDRMKLGFQEQTVGRHKNSGAPIGKVHEFDDLDLDAVDSEGNPLIAENAHARLAAPASNDGAQILRKGYSYDNGVARFAERWPPWRQAVTFDSGLLFQCYQRDPRTGFTRMFEKMSRFDMLNQFTTHIGSGVFACPPGAKEGEYIGQALFSA
jgi:deferrochelatase/peroxidase EfeB